MYLKVPLIINVLTFCTPLYTNVSNFYSRSHFWSLGSWYPWENCYSMQKKRKSNQWIKLIGTRDALYYRRQILSCFRENEYIFYCHKKKRQMDKTQVVNLWSFLQKLRIAITGQNTYCLEYKSVLYTYKHNYRSAYKFVVVWCKINMYVYTIYKWNITNNNTYNKTLKILCLLVIATIVS